MVKSIFLIMQICMALIISFTAYAGHEEYVVKDGDTLTLILFEKRLFPIYGYGGSLENVIRDNPVLAKNRGNKITPGMVISLKIQNEDIADVLDEDKVLDDLSPFDQEIEALFNTPENELPEFIQFEKNPVSEKNDNFQAPRSLLKTSKMTHKEIFADDRNYLLANLRR